MSKANQEKSKNNTDFGSFLSTERKLKQFSVEDISEQLKISVEMIVALESNDIETLPAPAYTQGYIRAYAKFLEISEQKVIDVYNVAVPHQQAPTLKPRTMLPDEASSQSLMMNIMTVVLVLAGLAAVIIGIFNYYEEKADVIETKLESKTPSFTGKSLDSPSEEHTVIKQKARLTEDGELILIGAESEAESVSPINDDAAMSQDEESANYEEVAEESVDEPVPESQDEVSTEVKVVAQDTGPLDILKIYAEKGSWMSVHDATDKRLLYNSVPVAGSKVLRGRAPFRVSLGNAKTTHLQINDLVVDNSEYVRTNNTAKFTVSTDGQSVIFH